MEEWLLLTGKVKEDIRQVIRERERLAAGAGSQSIYEHTVWGQQSESLL